MTHKYAVYNVNSDAWKAWSSDNILEQNSSIVSISEECFAKLQRIDHYPCGNDGSALNLEKRIMAYEPEPV